MLGEHNEFDFGLFQALLTKKDYSDHIFLTDA